MNVLIMIPAFWQALTSANVSDTALERACDTALHMLEKSVEVRARLVENGFKVAVIGVE